MGDGQRLAANLVVRSKTSELLESGDDQGSQPHKTSQSYRPLDNDSNEIRLLKVSPGFGSDMISCTLAHASLDSCLTYRAISYTWGGPTALKTILLDGEKFQVRRNAYDALLQLRSLSEFGIFWIDAICINQSDNSERNLQITKTRRIFSQATNVAIWLGRSYESSQRAFAFIGLHYQNRNSKEAIIRIIKDANAGEDLDAVVRLFNREYWNRVWVVQEIASASNSTVYCGNDGMAWDALFQVS
jgi:hypothetical protein